MDSPRNFGGPSGDEAARRALVNAVPQPSPGWAWQQWLQRSWAEIQGIEGDSRIVNLYIYTYVYIYNIYIYINFMCFLFFFVGSYWVVSWFFGSFFFDFGDCLPAERSFAQKWRPFLPGSAGAMFLAQPWKHARLCGAWHLAVALGTITAVGWFLEECHGARMAMLWRGMAMKNRRIAIQFRDIWKGSTLWWTNIAMENGHL